MTAARDDLCELPVFVYGTLTIVDVLTCLLGRTPRFAPAEVTGWRVSRLIGRPYPGLVRAAGVEKVRAYVLDDLSPAERRLIDDFEDPVYERVAVRLSGGASAVTHVAPADIATEDDWDAGAFARTDLPTYLANCASWVAARQGRPLSAGGQRLPSS